MPIRSGVRLPSRSTPASGWVFGIALLALWFTPSARAATNAEAAQRAINFLSADAANWNVRFGCTSCHRHGAAVFGLATARTTGYDLDALTYNGRTNRQNLEFVTERIQSEQRADGSWIHEGHWYPMSKTSYSAFGLAGYDANMGTRFSEPLVRAADWAVSQQEATGRWLEDFPFYPVGYGNVAITARLMTAISQAKQRVDPAKGAQYQAALDRAAAYVRAHMNDLTDGAQADGQRYTHQTAWAIVGLKAAGPGDNGVNTAALGTLATKLLATRALGDAPGWGTLAGEPADEFATGLSLYALCLAGRKPGADGRMSGALDWLKSRQAADGSWGVGTRYPDIPTTFAAMGLACFGDFSVGVSVNGAARRPLEHDLPNPQTATYVLTVRNHGYKTDEYSLSTQGGLPGWTATLDRTTLELGPDESTTVLLTITAPPGLAASLSSDVMVVAASDGAAGVKGATKASTYTTPPAPTEGLPTTTALLSPGSGPLTVALANTLSARVVDDRGWQARGPGMGVITFSVAGVTVGADNDADGDGVYSIVWRPRAATWDDLGLQDLRAVYSGVTLQPERDNRLGSTASQEVEVLPSPYPAPSVTLCGLPDFTGATSLTACGFTTPLAVGTSIESAAFIIHGETYPVVPDVNGGLVMASLPLRDGPNVVRLVATDTLGGLSSDEATVMVDNTAPEVTLLSPANGKALSVYSVDVQVVVRDWSPVRVETNWVHVTQVPAGGGTVTHTVWLNPGQNAILVRVTDAAGHATEQVVNVWVDAQAPFVGTGLPDGWLMGPQPGDTLWYGIGVYSASSTQVVVSSSGTYSLPRGGGAVNAQLHLVPGVNTFTIDVTSETGLTTSLTRTVRYDNSAPEAELVIPTPGGTYSGPIVLTARVTDTVGGVRGVAFTRDGSGIRAATLQPDGTWTAELDTRELVDGAHTVEVWMDDWAGNFVIRTFHFNTRNRP
ncbi:Ig-like domain-containing protein [Pyxidicoccus xibeiensis]|uniref:Ig-like domain-containing protein n=1 Tax=Pyxidicoccus xibeiensis TaxID=2906759 RepID=UPI0020A777B3|nr:Ig-like domain-containing protein [Pyxidicoccus xibeiensis]MCP3137156.1 Ig-like domain-containing protein [Pyxidicoccus xibeiensis]